MNLKERTRAAAAWLQCHPASGSFLIAASVVLAWSFHVGDIGQHFDANGYWFDADGRRFLDLAAYHSPLRGFLLPLLSDFIIDYGRIVGIPMWISLRLLYGAAFVALPTVAAPLLVERVVGIRLGLAPRLMAAALFIVFWRGYALYSLSDVPALLAATVAISVVLGAEGLARWPLAWRFATAGLLLAAATNMRPSYLATLVIMFVAAVVWHARLGGVRAAAIVAVAFVVGAVPVMGGQVLVDRAADMQRGPTSFQTLEGVPLYLVALSHGFRFLKYETNLHDPAWPQGGVAVADARGTALFARYVECCEQWDGDVGISYEGYLLMMARYPRQYTEFLAAHAFSAYDLWHPTPYLDRVAPRPWFRYANYLTWFVALASVVSLVRRYGIPSAVRIRLVLTAVALGASLLLTLPASIETRYFLAAYVFVYVAAAVGITEWLRSRPRPRRWWFAAATGALLWCVASSSISSGLVPVPPVT